MVNFLKAIFLIAVLLLTACGSELPDNEAGLRTLVTQIESDRGIFTKEEKNWRSGDVSSVFTTFSQNGKVLLIEENMTRGESGLSKNRFYFFNDELFCYREKRINTDDSVLEIEVFLNREGKVVAQKQLTDGKSSNVPKYVVPLAKKHGNTLLDLVNKKGE